MKAAEQRQIRLRLTFAAYAYEFDNNSLMGDGEFDDLCKRVDASIDTWTDQTYPEMIERSKKCDDFFRKHFSPHTGNWIRLHPLLDEIRVKYEVRYRWDDLRAGRLKNLCDEYGYNFVKLGSFLW